MKRTPNVAIGSFGLAAWLAVTSTFAQSPASEASNFEVEASRSVALPGQGRSLVVQRVRPPELPSPSSVPVSVPATAAELEPEPTPREWRALVVTATVYSDGLTYLRWWHAAAGGETRIYTAWSDVDFRSLWLASSFEVDGIDYNILPLVSDANGPSFVAPEGLGPLVFPADGPGFLVVEGDASDSEALLPIAALHQIYREEGEELAAAHANRELRLAAEAEERRLHPEPVRNTVVRFWPIRSNVFATETASPPSDQ